MSTPAKIGSFSDICKFFPSFLHICQIICTFPSNTATMSECATRKSLALLCHSLIAGHMWPAYFITRRVSEKILVFFLVRFEIITYLCIRTSPRCPGADGGGTSLEIYNKRLLLFGTLWNVGNFKSCSIRRISRKRLCIMHGRDLSGLTVIPTTSECGWWTSMLFCVVDNRLRR